MIDLLDELGELALGSRLRRLSEEIMTKGEEVYKIYNIDFDPRNFPVYYVISGHPKLSVTEIANMLNISHPAAIHNIRQLERKKLVISTKDKNDGRRRLLSLTKKGKQLYDKIQPAWMDIAMALKELLAATDIDLLYGLKNAEMELEKKNFVHRVREVKNSRQLEEVEIVPFSENIAHHFYDINEKWITSLFEMEEEDKKTLSNPKKQIIDKGGMVFFAKSQGHIAGTCGLKKWDDETYELVKMGVYEKFKGRQIGKKLGLEIIEEAKKRGCKRLFLESNSSLTPALTLYKRLGFVEQRNAKSACDYQRCDIIMDIKFDKNAG